MHPRPRAMTEREERPRTRRGSDWFAMLSSFNLQRTDIAAQTGKCRLRSWACHLQMAQQHEKPPPEVITSRPELLIFAERSKVTFRACFTTLSFLWRMGETLPLAARVMDEKSEKSDI